MHCCRSFYFLSFTLCCWIILQLLGLRIKFRTRLVTFCWVRPIAIRFWVYFWSRCSAKAARVSRYKLFLTLINRNNIEQPSSQILAQTMTAGWLWLMTCAKCLVLLSICSICAVVVKLTYTLPRTRHTLSCYNILSRCSNSSYFGRSPLKPW